MPWPLAPSPETSCWLPLRRIIDWSTMDELDATPMPPPLPSVAQDTTTKPQVWPCFVLFGIEVAVVLGVGMTVGLALLVYHGAQAVTSEQTWIQYYTEFLATIPGLLMMAPSGIAAAAMAVGAAILSKTPWPQRLRLERGTSRWWVCIPAVVGILALGRAMMDAMQLCGIGPGLALTAIYTALASLTGVRLVVAVMVIGVVAGTAEELLFRGYIQSRFQQRWGAILAVSLTSVLFGLLHLDVIHSPLAAMLGLYLGYLAIRTGSIRLPILAHVMNNAISVLLTAGHVAIPSTVGTLTISCLLLALAVLLIHIGTRGRIPGRSPSQEYCQLPQ